MRDASLSARAGERPRIPTEAPGSSRGLPIRATRLQEAGDRRTRTSVQGQVFAGQKTADCMMPSQILIPKAIRQQSSSRSGSPTNSPSPVHLMADAVCVWHMRSARILPATQLSCGASLLLIQHFTMCPEQVTEVTVVALAITHRRRPSSCPNSTPHRLDQ